MHPANDNDPQEIYGAGTLKRERRTKAQIQQLDDQIVDVLRKDHPQSVRHVFYRMTDPRLLESVEKSERGYRTVQSRLVELRRSGRIPYGWITDATRQGYHTPTFNGPAEFLRSMKALYRADLWRDSQFYCEVWVESRSIAGVIHGVCRELAVPLYPAGGFASLSLAYQAADHINAVHNGRHVVIFYIGDLDPAGVLIDKSIEKELRQHLNPGIQLNFFRLGITEDQIAKYDLPTKPRKQGDKRSQHIETTVEAEAMPAGELREMLRWYVERLLPHRALEVAKAAEDSAREHFELLEQLSAEAA